MGWNHFGLSPGAASRLHGGAALVALVISYPCFRLKIVGHYFALVTLALSEVARMIIVALRDQTGGSLGVTPNTALADTSWSLAALQFSSKVVWFYIILAVWLAGLWIWTLVDRSMARIALEAISQEEDAAASIGIGVTRLKLGVTMISALMTCIGGVLYAQYQLYLNPENLRHWRQPDGVRRNRRCLFAPRSHRRRGFRCCSPRICGWPWVDIHGLDTTVYGLLLVLFIIFMPKGILGMTLALWRSGVGRRATTA
jgi:branched-chain amino acid transport system permease protein